MTGAIDMPAACSMAFGQSRSEWTPNKVMRKLGMDPDIGDIATQGAAIAERKQQLGHQHIEALLGNSCGLPHSARAFSHDLLGAGESVVRVPAKLTARHHASARTVGN